jgi:hypothetical protein
MPSVDVLEDEVPVLEAALTRLADEQHGGAVLVQMRANRFVRAEHSLQTQLTLQWRRLLPAPKALELPE